MKKDQRPKWIFTERKYHGVPDGRFLVHREEKLKGICECFTEGDAETLCLLLNSGDYRMTDYQFDAVDGDRSERGI